MGLIALGFWLYVIDPVPAVIAVLACSVAAQAATIRAIWHIIEPRRVLPFIVPGLFGIPIGLMLLGTVPVSTFKSVMGLVLVVFATLMLLVRRPLGFKWGGRIADGVLGFVGGVLGGFAGLSGSLPTIWAVLRGWGKDEKRSVFQAYNFSILGVSLIGSIIAGRADKESLVVLAAALPGAFIGARLGIRMFARLSDRRFTDVILALMIVSGALMLSTAR